MREIEKHDPSNIAIMQLTFGMKQYVTRLSSQTKT